MLAEFRHQELTASGWLASDDLPRIGAWAAQRAGLGVDDLDDLVQEVRISIWKAGPDAVLNSAWVFRAAWHRAIDVLKKRKRRLGLSSALEFAPPRRDASLELRMLFGASVARLPPAVRMVCAMTTAGYAEREIAAALGISRRTVRARIACYLRMLRGRPGYHATL